MLFIYGLDFLAVAKLISIDLFYFMVAISSSNNFYNFSYYKISNFNNNKLVDSEISLLSFYLV